MLKIRGIEKDPEKNLSEKASLSRFTESRLSSSAIAPRSKLTDTAVLSVHPRNGRGLYCPGSRAGGGGLRFVRTQITYASARRRAVGDGRSRHVENLEDRYAALGGGGKEKLPDK